MINALILTGTSLFCRTVGVSFNVYLSKKIGAGGIGLFELIVSVYTLFVTFATSGIQYASTRLISEALAKDDKPLAGAVFRACVAFAAVLSALSSLVLFAFAPYLGTKVLCDIRTVKSLKLLALSLMPIALSNVISGYFSAQRGVYKTAVSGILAQLIKLISTFVLLSFFTKSGLENACVSLVLSTLISEAFSFLSALFFYIFDKNKPQKDGSENALGLFPQALSKLLKTAVPIALSSYARTGLLSLEHVLIPRGLQKNGAGANAALAAYGTLHGMVFPVILFPSSLLGAVSGLIIPELTEMSTVGKDKLVCKSVNFALNITLVFSIGIAGGMSWLSDELSAVLYDSADAGAYIKLLCALIPVMYLDGIVDGALKGLGQQLYSMRCNLLDSFLSVVLVYTLLPRFGIDGYLVSVFITETLNFVLSIMRLLKMSRVRPNLFFCIFLPTATAVVSVFVCDLVSSLMPKTPMVLSLVLHIILYIFVYLLLCKISGIFASLDFELFFPKLTSKTAPKRKAPSFLCAKRTNAKCKAALPPPFE